MVEYVRNWEKGINAFFIVINIHEIRLTEEIQRIIKLMNYFYNDATMWNRTGIIFTKCYAYKCDKNTASTDYRSEVIKFIKSLDGWENIDFEMPCFFVDSTEYKTEKSTRDEYKKILEFAHKFEPIQTTKFREINPDYMMIENETKLRQKKGEEVFNESDTKRIRRITYQDQRISILTDWNGRITYSPPELIKEWSEKQIEEKQVLQRQLIKTEIFQDGNVLIKRFHYEDQERYLITYEDNKISYSPTKMIRSWTEDQKEEKQIIKNHQAKIEYEGQGRNKRKIIYYEDIEITKITSPTGEIAYSTPTILNFYNITILSSVKKEEKVEVISETIELTHTEKRDTDLERFGKGLLHVVTFGIVDIGPDLVVIHDGWKVITKYGKFQRDVIVDPDGNETYGEWILINEWKEEKTMKY